MTTIRWSGADAEAASVTQDRPSSPGTSLLVVDNSSPTLDLGFVTGRGFVVASVDSPNPTADLLVAEHEVPALADLCARNPQAAAVASQQLRLAEQLPAHAALVSESLAYATLQAGPEHERWLQINRERRRVRPPFDTPAVLVTDHGTTAELQLNRSRLKNSFTTEMRNQLHDALHALALRPEVETVEISGIGSDFCIGGDLAEFGIVSDPATAHVIRSAGSVARQLVECQAHLVFRVHGASVGAGVELAAFGETVIAAPGATFALPEVSMGLIPGAGGTVSLTNRVGRQSAARLLLVDPVIDADQALTLGLVDRVEPAN